MNTCEIKFRVWDKTSVCWVSDYENAVRQNRLKFFIDTTGKIGKIIYPLYEGDGSEDNVVNPENYVIQQYTGLEDKNNVEIYEGDIISHKGYKGQVSFFAGMYLIDYPDQTDSGPIGFLQTKDIEVIGNIFENEDLLKV